MSERLHFAAFEPHVASTFRLTPDAEHPAFDVTLVGAEELVTGSESEESFSLVFRGPVEPRLEQMIRHLEHPALGELDLFLVPVREDGDGRDYEAIFSYRE